MSLSPDPQAGRAGKEIPGQPVSCPGVKNLAVRIILAFAAILMAAVATSCHSSASAPGTTPHNAFVTFPKATQVGQLEISESGVISLQAKTTPILGYSPSSLALHPSNKFLYVANSTGNSIFLYNVASDGSLTETGNPTAIPGGSGPVSTVTDPAGKFLFVANNFSNNISVFSIDAGSGALTQVSGSPFPASPSPTRLLVSPTGKYLYATIPGSGGGYVEA